MDYYSKMLDILRTVPLKIAKIEQLLSFNTYIFSSYNHLRRLTLYIYNTLRLPIDL